MKRSGGKKDAAAKRSARIAGLRGGRIHILPLGTCRLFKRFNPDQLIFVLGSAAILLALTLYRYVD